MTLNHHPDSPLLVVAEESLLGLVGVGLVELLGSAGQHGSNLQLVLQAHAAFKGHVDVTSMHSNYEIC